MPSSHEPEWTRKYGRLEVAAFESSAGLAAHAVADLAVAIDQAIAARGIASIILATGNSQLEFMAALRQTWDIKWPKVQVFHMDDYLGMPEDHPASFRRY